MFHSPILHVKNMHPETRVGIEIEICIKKEKYDKIIFKKDTKETYSNNLEAHYEFEHGNPFKAGVEDSLDKIILTVDPTCVCEEGFVNAEIISPKMDATEIPIFFYFLKTVVFNNPDDFYQGETCGIHVHWSNTALMLNNDHNYLFLFFKLINNLRHKLDFKLINSHFSGRQFLYNKMYKDLTLATNQVDKGNYFIPHEYIEVKDVNTKSLNDVLDELNLTEVTVYRNISFTKKVFYDKMLNNLVKNKEISKLLYHFVCSNLNYFTGKGNTKVTFDDDFFDSKMVDFENMDIDDDLLEKCAQKYLRIKLGFNYFKTSSEEIIFKQCDEFLLKKFLYGNVFEPSLTEVFWVFYNKIDSGVFYFIEREGNYWFTSFYDDFKEHFSKKTEPIILYHKHTLDELFDIIMITQKKLPDVSIYNITEGFHMEMRMFSLDSLLFGKTKVPSETIINELTRFLLYTDNFMMNVISVLNHVYDSKNEIKRDKLTILEKTLLFGKRPNPAQVKKICRRLFAMELVDKVTNRYLRLPVGEPGQSYKSHIKQKPSMLTFGKNNIPLSRKSKKKPSVRVSERLPTPEENNLFNRTEEVTKPPTPLGKKLSRRQRARAKNELKESESKSYISKKKSHRSKKKPHRVRPKTPSSE
jgi:hypothetical protein